MPRLFNAKRKGPGRQSSSTGTTAVSFSAEDLEALGKLVAVGRSVLQTSHPVVGRLKAAMTRMKVPVPQGL